MLEPEPQFEIEVSELDRSELIRLIRGLERQRAAWVGRLTQYAEREEMYKGYVHDMADFLKQMCQAHAFAAGQLGMKAQEIITTVEAMMDKTEAV